MMILPGTPPFICLIPQSPWEGATSEHTQNKNEVSDDSHVATHGYSSQKPIASVMSLIEVFNCPRCDQCEFEKIAEHSHTGDKISMGPHTIFSGTIDTEWGWGCWLSQPAIDQKDEVSRNRIDKIGIKLEMFSMFREMEYCSWRICEILSNNHDENSRSHSRLEQHLALARISVAAISTCPFGVEVSTYLSVDLLSNLQQWEPTIRLLQRTEHRPRVFLTSPDSRQIESWASSSFRIPLLKQLVRWFIYLT